MQFFLNKCTSLAGGSDLSAKDQHNLHLLTEDLETYIRGAKYKG